MKPHVSCITLPVGNLKSSLEFYGRGIGLPMDDVSDVSPQDDHIAIQMEGGLYLVLIEHAEFSVFTDLAGQEKAPVGASECVLSYFASGREEVEQILERGSRHGGTVAGKPQERDWGYCGYIKDPDGHLWEIMYNPTLNEDA